MGYPEGVCQEANRYFPTEFQLPLPTSLLIKLKYINHEMLICNKLTCEQRVL